jgi:hypothetical protein
MTKTFWRLMMYVVSALITGFGSLYLARYLILSDHNILYSLFIAIASGITCSIATGMLAARMENTGTAISARAVVFGLFMLIPGIWGVMKWVDGSWSPWVLDLFFLVLFSAKFMYEGQRFMVWLRAKKKVDGSLRRALRKTV